MRFLLISYNFSPEKTGIGKYNGEWAEWLVRCGHQVDVVTSNPYYPEWDVHKEYKQSQWRTEYKDKLTIYRTPMYVPKRVTSLKRILSDFSFGITSLITWVRLLLHRKKYDVVIAVCPSMLNGIIPVLYCRFSGSLLLYHIQDLQLDAAIEMGLIKNRYLLSSLNRIEKFQLDNADVVSSISEGMKAKILLKGVSPSRYYMLENWVDTDFIKSNRSGKAWIFKRELGFKDSDKIILYSGNLGEKQGIEVLIEAAVLLRAYKEWKFLICGDGVARIKLQERAKEAGLQNVNFIPLQPYERLPELLSLGDLHLVPQRKATTNLMLPSKLTGILAAGGVCIVAVERNTALYNLMLEQQIGYTVEPENAEELARTVKEAFSRDNTGISQRARSFAERSMSREAILSQFDIYIRKKVAQHSGIK